MTRPPILLTDPDERSTLAAARALVAAGYPVTVAGSRRWSLAGVSRGVRVARIRHDPLTGGPAYVDDLAEVVRRQGIGVLVPTTDAAMGAILEHAARLPSGLVLPVPDAPTFAAASDKIKVLVSAAAAGLAVPDSVVLPRADAGVSLEAVRYPAVVKPHRSVVGHGPDGLHQKVAVTFVANEVECRARLAALPAEAYPVLVQRRIRGPGEGIFLLRWGERIVARFGHRRLREKPPAGGVSVYRESVAVEPEFGAAAERLLAALGWRGVAMVECKRDIETGRLVLMEINGRLWGSLQLALDSGVDFPVLLARCALGDEIPDAPPAYRAGVRTRWFWGDVDHLTTRILHSRSALHLPPDAPSRWGVIRDFFHWVPGRDHWEVGRLGDPGPALLETVRRLLPGG